MMRDQEFYEEVRRTAHALYCERGVEYRRDLEDLLTAETLGNERFTESGKDNDSGRRT